MSRSIARVHAGYLSMSAGRVPDRALKNHAIICGSTYRDRGAGGDVRRGNASLSATHTAEPGTGRRLVPHGVLVESHDFSPRGVRVLRSISASRHADALTPTEPVGAVAVSPRGSGPPLNSVRSASATCLFGACSAFTHLSACLFSQSAKVTLTRVLQRASLPPCAALVASGRATDWPGRIRTHWSSPTCTAH